MNIETAFRARPGKTKQKTEEGTVRRKILRELSDGRFFDFLFGEIRGIIKIALG